MIPEFNETLTVPVSTAVAAAAVAAVVIVLLLVLWLRNRSIRRRETAERVEADRVAMELELTLREQLGRLRIIRELHEVVVHSVSNSIRDADGARYAAQNDPGAAVRALASIGDHARLTLADLRRVMTVVREGEADGAPQPRLRSARDLFKVMRDAGLAITFTETGEPFEMVQGAELAIYRILQESLSNSLKYGGEGTVVAVSFAWRGESLQVLIEDEGERNRQQLAGIDAKRRPADAAYTAEDDLGALTRTVSGPGITEMRERAELFGGVFNATQVPGIGFSVSVSFPHLRRSGAPLPSTAPPHDLASL